jgi:hypothetical protein
MKIAIRLTAALLLAALAPSAAPAQTLPQGRAQPPHAEPLKPGRSAGVKAAQAGIPNIGLALVGVSAVIGLVLVTSSGGGKGDTSQPNSQSAVGTAP